MRGSRGEGRGEYEKAINDYEAAIETNPGDARAHARLARLLSVCHLAEWRDAVQGVAHATKACELTEWAIPTLSVRWQVLMPRQVTLARLCSFRDGLLAC